MTVSLLVQDQPEVSPQTTMESVLAFSDNRTNLKKEKNSSRDIPIIQTIEKSVTSVTPKRSLTNSKDKSDEYGNKPVARRPNMLSITGEECYGLQVSPSFITTFFLMFILAADPNLLTTKGKSKTHDKNGDGVEDEVALGTRKCKYSWECRGAKEYI